MSRVSKLVLGFDDMSLFRLIVLGHFCAGGGAKRLIALPEFESKPVAGFYTTRLVDASDCAEAAELAADSIQKELIDAIGEEASICELEIESCELVDKDDDTLLSKGFTFFASD